MSDEHEKAAPPASDASVPRLALVARPWVAMVLLALLAFSVEALIAWAPRADLFGPDWVRGNHHGEEFSRGNIAVEIVRGPILPLYDYQWAHFFGGSLVMGLLAVPLFALLGPSLFVLKLTPAIFQAVAAACAFGLLDRVAGRRAAWIGGALLAIGLPGYSAIGTIAWGVHLELNTFVLAALWLYATIVDAGGRVPRRWFALGVLGGFATWFGYGFLVTVATIGVVELVRNRRFPITPSFPALLCGFVIGFLPWIVYNLANDFAGLAVYGSTAGEHFTGGHATQIGSRIATLFGDVLPNSFWFADLAGVPGYAISMVVMVLLLAASALGAVRLLRRGAAGATLVAFPLVYLAVFLSGDFFETAAVWESLPQLRYLCPLHPPLLLVGAVGVAGLGGVAARGARRALPAVVGLALLVVLVVGNLGLVDTAQRGALARLPGYSTYGHGVWLVERYGTRPDVFTTIARHAIERRTPEERDGIFRGIAGTLKFMTSPGASIEDPENTPARARTLLRLRATVPYPEKRWFEPGVDVPRDDLRAFLREDD